VTSGASAVGRTRTLDSHASRLRRKLSAAGGDFVRNVWGVGYALVNDSVNRASTKSQPVS
jgi:DNA-binding response OmpR family regulator